LTTYSYSTENLALIAAEKIKRTDDSGYFIVSIGQSVITSSIDWQKKTIMGAIGQVGAQALSVVAIFSFILGNY